MKKIIAVLFALLFSFGVVGSAIASGGDPTSCDRWWESYFEGKYVASYDGHSSSYDDDHKDGYSSSYDDDHKDGYSSSYDDDHYDEKDD